MIDAEILTRARALLATGIGTDGLKQVLHIEGLSETDIAEVLAVLPVEGAPLAAAVQPASQPVTPIGQAQTQTPRVPTPVPTMTITPPPQMTPPKPPSPPPKRHTFIKFFIFTLLFLVVCASAAAGAYAYLEKIGPFAKLPYGESDLITGLLSAGSKIDSGAYKVTASLTVVPRDAGATPFTVQVSNAEELRQQYQHDSERLSSVMGLLNAFQRNLTAPYPASLQGAVDKVVASKNGSYLKNYLKTIDPATDLPFSYHTINAGKDFEITVQFETKAAIDALTQSMRYASSTTKIAGQTATFTSGSNTFAYMSSEPPKPLLVMLGEYMRMVPAQMSASLSAGAATDWKSEASEWKFNVDATGDFGDLTYKIDADALKKGKDYYFRVNNIPSLFAQFLAGMKGTWIKISPDATSSMTSMHNEFSYIASSLPDQEKKYKENREQLVQFIRKVASFADEEHLVLFRNPPKSERVDGKLLYRYDLRLNKSAMLPFYKKMYEEAKKNEGVNEYHLFNDPGTIEYLQSEEFSQVFDYLDANTQITLWVDPQGFPAGVSYTMRVVPPDTATQVKDKQVMLTLKLDMTDINVPVNIEAPADAKSIEEISQQVQSNLDYSLDDARTKGRDAKRISDIKQLQLALELYFSAHNEYPTSLDPLLKAGYIVAIPKDPQTNQQYLYAALGGAKCSSYHLAAVLEATNSATGNDSDAAPMASCKKSVRKDFNGNSATCGTTKSSPDNCYDVKP